MCVCVSVYICDVDDPLHMAWLIDVLFFDMARWRGSTISNCVPLLMEFNEVLLHYPNSHFPTTGGGGGDPDPDFPVYIYICIYLLYIYTYSTRVHIIYYTHTMLTHSTHTHTHTCYIGRRYATLRLYIMFAVSFY